MQCIRSNLILEKVPLNRRFSFARSFLHFRSSHEPPEIHEEEARWPRKRDKRLTQCREIDNWLKLGLYETMPCIRFYFANYLIEKEQSKTIWGTCNTCEQLDIPRRVIDRETEIWSTEGKAASGGWIGKARNQLIVSEKFKIIAMSVMRNNAFSAN